MPAVTQRIRKALRWDQIPTRIRRILAGLVGGTVLLIGVALLVLPGPAFIVIPLGLAILASEFAWARGYLKKARDYFSKHREDWIKKRRARKAARQAAV